MQYHQDLDSKARLPEHVDLLDITYGDKDEKDYFKDLVEALRPNAALYCNPSPGRLFEYVNVGM